MKEIAALERTAESVALDMETTGRLPDGSRFRTAGRLRVLGTTHVRSFREAHFGDGMDTETESVLTPDGLSMRERDPAQGEVFTFMPRALLERLSAARDHLAERGALGGLPAGPGPSGAGEAPLGSAVLTGLDQQFALTVRGPEVIDGQRYWVVGGPARALPNADDAQSGASGFAADHVDVLVRERDAAVIRMTQLRDGQPVLDVRITRLELDRPLDENVFAMPVPEGVRVLDVFDHPPARAQIERIFEEARSHGWEDPGDDSGPPDDGTRSGVERSAGRRGKR